MRGLNRLPDRGGQGHRGAQHEARGTGPAQLSEQLHHLLGVVDPDPEHERVGGKDGDVDRVMDHHAADVLSPVQIAVERVQQRGAQVVENPTETGARA